MIIAAELLGIIGRRRFIAEVRTETALQGLNTIEALARGGITVFEISLGIPGAEELLRHFSGNQTIFVGAGSVLDARQAHEAARAGATFIAAPIVAPEVVQVCSEHRVACVLGALTPTEIISAQRAGADLVNIFPISAMGGSNYLRSLYRQFQSLNIMISGGITLENAFEFLALPVRALGLSSTITPREVVERGDWNMLTHLARQFIMATQQDDPAQSVVAPSAIPPRAPILDTTRAPAFQPPSAPAPAPPAPEPSYEEFLDPTWNMGNSSHPGASSRPMPAVPSQPGMRPAASQPPAPPSRPGAASQPPAPPPAPGTPDPFRPWDSKPAGDDWMN